MDEKTEEKKYSGYGYHGGGRKATGIKRVSFSVSCQPEELEKKRNWQQQHQEKLSAGSFWT